jgi:hypothetical protein
MNKYARIDKKCRKMFVYDELYSVHNYSPAAIADKFHVQIDTVVRALKAARIAQAYYYPDCTEATRAAQIAWTYVY